MAAAALALLCAAAPAAAGVWRGTLGGEPLVAVFAPQAADGDPAGRFYTPGRPTDGWLATAPGASGPLAEHVQPFGGDADTVTARWQLRRVAPGQVAGVRISAAGRRETVRLAFAGGSADRFAVGVAAPAPAGTDDDALYARERRRLLTWGPPRRERLGRYVLAWRTEPASGIAGFTVAAGYPLAERARLNAVLLARRWQSVDDYFACRMAPRYAFGASITVRLMTPQVMSVSVFSRYDCGGAHPDFGDAPLTLDVATGRALQLDDVLELKAEDTSHSVSGAADASGVEVQSAAGSAGADRLASWIAARMRELHPEEVRSGAARGCDYADASVWATPTWYLLPQGLYLGPSFPRVNRACEYPHWTVLPWRVARQHPGPWLRRHPLAP